MDRSFGVPELMIVLVISLVIGIISMLPWFFIYRKAGYHPAMGCLMFIPLVNLIMMFILAFMEWPIERDLKDLRASRPEPPPELPRL